MANQYGNSLPPIVCLVCKFPKTRTCFSYNDRNLGAVSGYKNTCKECSAKRAQKEKERRELKGETRLCSRTSQKKRCLVPKKPEVGKSPK